MWATIHGPSQNIHPPMRGRFASQVGKMLNWLQREYWPCENSLSVKICLYSFFSVISWLFLQSVHKILSITVGIISDMMPLVFNWHLKVPVPSCLSISSQIRLWHKKMPPLWVKDSHTPLNPLPRTYPLGPTTVKPMDTALINIMRFLISINYKSAMLCWVWLIIYRSYRHKFLFL